MVRLKQNEASSLRKSEAIALRDVTIEPAASWGSKRSSLDLFI